MDLAGGDFALTLAPELGNSILRFEWRGEPLMRAGSRRSPLDTACFPLVPFSNRIAHGRFVAGGREVRLSPNFPGSEQFHPLHGFGWLSPWSVIAMNESSVLLEHCYEAAEWPWSYTARQEFELTERDLRVIISVENHSDTVMPAGLGLHPYFPRNEDTIFRSLHHGEWHNDAECLPDHLDERRTPVDWWADSPVSARTVDTVYTDRHGPLTIVWPDRALELAIEPSPGLRHTVVYVPAGGYFFCVEPVSHATDALNRPAALAWLRQGERLAAEITFTPCSTAHRSATR